MEHAKVELEQVEKAVEVAAADQVQQLAELSLVVVGGGTGEVVFA